jgi:HEAT repeat protein
MRRQQLLVCLLCLGLGPPTSLLAQMKKPADGPYTEVGGHTLEYWTGQIASKDQSKSEIALRMIVQFSPDKAYHAVPVILDRLRRHPNTRVDASVCAQGAIALGVILGNYKEADHKTIKDAVSILKRFLSDTQAIIKLRAVQALGSLGTDARDAIPEVITLVRDASTFETRKAAALALGQIAVDKTNGPSLNVLNALYAALSDGSLQVRLAALQSLTWLGSPGNATLRQGLVNSLDLVTHKDADDSMKIWAHMAVMNITGSIDQERIEKIAQMLNSPEPFTRVQAAQALGAIGEKAKGMVPRLINKLSDPDPASAYWAAWALGRIGPAAANALPALERIKMDSTQLEPIRKMAQEAVDLINGKKK